jgi:carotenoid cleavage dioxygenase
MTVTENPFLAGNYGPVSEERTETDLAVEGAVPTELRGRYMRTGPNPPSPPDGQTTGSSGDGMVHGVELGGGAARWYRNRWCAP